MFMNEVLHVSRGILLTSLLRLLWREKKNKENVNMAKKKKTWMDFN